MACACGPTIASLCAVPLRPLPSLLLCPPTTTPQPPSPPQVISYYKDRVVNIKADRPQDEVAKQVEKAVA